MSIRSSPRGRWILVAAVAILAIATAVIQLRGTPIEKLLQNARAAFNRGHFAESQAVCQTILANAPGCREALLMAGRSAIRLKDLDRALEFLAQLPGASDAELSDAWNAAGDLALQSGRALDAEKSLRQALATFPEHHLANIRLAYLLGVEGRCWEARPLLLASIIQQKFTVHHLVLLGASEPVIADQALIDRCTRAVPSDPVPLIGLARNALQQNNPSVAEALLRKVISAAPQSVEAHATLGRVLVVSHPDEIPAWQLALPADADNHPDIWSARGEWAMQAGQPQSAIRCFWEAVRRNPDHRTGSFHLANLLAAGKEPHLAKPFADRADRLRELVLLIDRLYSQPDSLDLFRQAAKLTESLGRIWEAWGWSTLALNQSPGLPWAVDNVARLQFQLDRQSTQTIHSANPALQIDLSMYSLPLWPTSGLRKSTTESGRSQCAVKFSDVAASAGLAFTYLNHPGSMDSGSRMLETTGGGVAVIDYDGDGWPDIYFTQGSPWPPNAEQPQTIDHLFRNRGDGRVEDVTLAARLGDPRYGQGVTSGDFDNDGFQDLYVANIGENRLYHNNGDGTFSDVSAVAGITGALWTTSCLIADLNGDSLPDLYDVNYLSAQAAATQICRHGEEVRWCSPDAFEAEQDQVYLNLGDGTFQNVTASAGIVVPNGKGLGIIAADFDGSGRLSLFVANDAVANGLFVNQTRQPGSTILLREQAVLSGLAFDRDGLPQACMGVAAGDADNNGYLDLFVTNYADQSNTLYCQQPGLLFEDNTRRAGLRDPGYAMLGFGTQFLDADLDGHRDLVVTNGHVFDLSYNGTPFEMPPQYYSNHGNGRFSEISSQTLGPYFQRKALGRGLARLDWNRDGREDFVVSHMNSPAALVENQTAQTGRFLSITLRGRQGSRDAIGTAVVVTAGNQEWTQQLTAGDGFQASNERRLIFGLGKHLRVDRLVIRWPSGIQQQFESLSADREMLMIEGSPPICINAP